MTGLSVASAISFSEPYAANPKNGIFADFANVA